MATTSWTVSLGASLLFLTNLVTIAISAAILARIYGFASDLSPRQTGFQAALVIMTFPALAIPLGISLNRIAWETLASRQAGEVIARHFGDRARLSDISIDFDVRPIAIDATVLAPQFRPGAEHEARQELELALRRPVQVTIDQFRVAVETDADAAQVKVARGDSVDRARGRIAERLALVAGVQPQQVLVDPVGARAVVRAQPLPRADLSSSRALEARIAAAEPAWSVNSSRRPSRFRASS